jgi:hypothetical protein
LAATLFPASSRHGARPQRQRRLGALRLGSGECEERGRGRVRQVPPSVAAACALNWPARKYSNLSCEVGFTGNRRPAHSHAPGAFAAANSLVISEKFEIIFLSHFTFHISQLDFTSAMFRRQLLRIAQQTPRSIARAPITTRIRPFSLTAQVRAEQPESPADPRDPQISELKVSIHSFYNWIG